MTLIDFSRVETQADHHAVEANQQISLECDQQLSCVLFEGRTYNGDAHSRQRIFQAYVLARLALMEGVSPTEECWHGGVEPFAWIDVQNQFVPMDAETMCHFGKAALYQEQQAVVQARKAKDAM